MKKLILLSFVIPLFIYTANAQESMSIVDINRARHEIISMSRSDINNRASSNAKNETKSLEKEGWRVSSTALPMVKQLSRSYLMQYEFDDAGYPVYIFGEASSKGSDYSSVRSEALEYAKHNLASRIQYDIMVLVYNSVLNRQLEATEATNIIERITDNIALIEEEIGRTITVVELCRELDKQTIEVFTRIAYNGDIARSAVISAIRRNPNIEDIALHSELEQLIK